MTDAIVNFEILSEKVIKSDPASCISTQELLSQCIKQTLLSENHTNLFEVNVSFVDNEQIKQMNFENRQIDSITDVLSFPLLERETFERNSFRFDDKNPETGAIMLGDIVISIDRAVEQAMEYSHHVVREICFLTVHSMLHLLGYDHENSKLEESLMIQKQNTVLNHLGVTRDKTF